MARKVFACVSLVILALVLAGPGAKAAAIYSIDGAVSSSSSLARLEDGVAPELAVVTTADLEVHRDILRGIGTGALDPSKPGCLPLCAGKGLPYTGRRCNPYNHCPPKK
ncbi:hypothetical protein VPH35_063382 [Triticum aestivum]|uniref:uncharacterized protein n=1 Tax=Triticum aestivum TaxID=4565 RepID=UPI000842EA6D|nr:uncharacterized protein LOC123080736 [Triticum aestivum]